MTALVSPLYVSCDSKSKTICSVNQDGDQRQILTSYANDEYNITACVLYNDKIVITLQINYYVESFQLFANDDM